MIFDNLLSLMTFVPGLGALILALLLRGEGRDVDLNAKYVALFASSAALTASLFVFAGFEPGDEGFQFVEETDWILGLTYKMGVDGISILFVLLTTILMPITILACWDMTHRVKEYMIALLVLETMILGAFCALDLVLFFLFTEGALLPIFLLIGIWGGAERIHASFKVFFYALFGSVLMLMAMLAMYVDAGTSDIAALMNHNFGSETMELYGITVLGGMQTLLWLGFFASFAIKMPIWPMHTWMPDAHAEAPTAVSVVLAALLFKIGGYGLLRFNLPMFPVASELLSDFVLWLSAIAIVYASLVALVQEDMKRLIAYSAVAHMGLVTAGIFATNQQAVDGAVFHMVSHGFIVAALFLCVGALVDRIKTREIDGYGGLAERMPAHAAVFLLFTAATLGLPGTSGFVGVFLTIMGVFEANTAVAVVAAIGTVLTAAYALSLYRRLFLGALIKESLKSVTDISARERTVFAALGFIVLVLGIYPSLVTDLSGPTVSELLAGYQTAVAEFAAANQVAAAGGQ